MEGTVRGAGGWRNRGSCVEGAGFRCVRKGHTCDKTGKRRTVLKIPINGGKGIMKKFAAVSLALLVSLSSAACDQDMDDDSMDSPDQYLQASSTITQCPGMAPEVVQMDITDAASGVAMAANQMTVEESGAYLIVAAPQVGREGAGPYGCFDLWLRVNGTDVANSNVQLCQDEGSMAKDVIISQGIVPLEAGDVVEVMMSAGNREANMCIEAIQPEGEPLVPSIIFSMIKY